MSGGSQEEAGIETGFTVGDDVAVGSPESAGGFGGSVDTEGDVGEGLAFGDLGEGGVAAGGGRLAARDDLDDGRRLGGDRMVCDRGDTGR